MTSMRSTVLTALLLALVFAAPARAVEGGAFQTIVGIADPEEYTTVFNLDADQELVAIDDQHAAVLYKAGPQAFSIAASPAHDSEGATVPTKLAVVQPNLVVLTVHHRDGNPAAGGAPFHYPISAGVGWSGDSRTYPIVMPIGEQPAPSSLCVVPDLTGRTVRASRRILHRAHCKLGGVRGDRNRASRVVKQFRPAGKSLAAWTAVGVKVS